MKVQQGAYTFTLELDAPILKEGKNADALVDALPKNLTKDGLSNLKNLVDQKAEGVWVQSRLMVLLGLTAPDETVTTSSTVEASIRATTESDDEEDGTTFSCFACKDGRTRLQFGPKTKADEAKRIAKAFWKVLLSEPSELDDFSAETIDHSGAKVAYGVRDGRCFFGDPDDDDIDIPSGGSGADIGRGLADFDPSGMVGDDDDAWLTDEDDEDDWDDEDDEDEDDDDRGGFGFLGDDDDDNY